MKEAAHNPNTEYKLQALKNLGIVPVDVVGGVMWCNQTNGRRYWHASKALADLDLSDLDNEYTRNDMA